MGYCFCSPAKIHQFSAISYMTEKPKKKILYLITKSNFGGAQRYVFDLATNLDPSEYEVAVALGGSGRLKHELQAAGVRVIPLTHLERDISTLKEVKAACELFKIIRDEKPAILHINSSKAGGLGGFLGRLLRVKQIIFTAHGWAFNEARPQWQKMIIHFLHWLTVFLSHRTIVVSETTKSQMTGPCISHKMEVVYNGRVPINFLSRSAAREYFSTLIPALATYKDDFWSTTIAELHKVKQHDVVIRALKEVVSQFPSVRHIIMGEGDERKGLEALINECGLQEHVFLAGNVPEGAEYLKAFDLFILGSRSEALAYAIIEAAMAELPILASRVGGIPEILTSDENGILFPEGNVDALAKEYTDLYKNTAKRHELGRKAKERSEEFSFDNALAKTLRLYKTSEPQAR